MNVADRAIAISIGVVAAAAYVVAGFGLASDYDHFGRLAEAFLQGRWWLVDPPSWIGELVPCADGRGLCVVYPPLPALLAIPLVPLFSTATAQVLVSRLAGGASAGVLYYALRAYGAPRLYALTGSVLSAFGTTLLFSSVDGRAPFAAHPAAMLFLAGSFAVAARGGPPVIVGALLGVSALGRLPVALAAPALALLAARRSGVSYRRAVAGVIVGGIPFAIGYAGYNLVRFGTPLETGYATLVQGDVFFSQGLLSLFYLPRQLYAIFLALPDLVGGSPFFLRPRIFGMSLFLTTPAFLWLFAALRQIRRDDAVGATALAALLALSCDLLFGSVGSAQFGYRFSIDAQPFLVALALTADGRRGGTWRRWPSVAFIVAAVLSLAMNLYAAIAITRFGYWM
jgi:hypothetical protein